MVKKIEDIEILRAFGIIFVVLHHMNGSLTAKDLPLWHDFFRYFSGGVGVDLFFAVSGFVISRSIYRQFTQTRDRKVLFRNAVIFWIRRGWRLLPSAWLWLLLILLMSIFFNESEVFGSVEANLRATLAGALNFANVRFANTFGVAPYGASFVYWSLSLEEQFYFGLPLVLMMFGKKAALILIPIILWQLGAQRDLLMMVTRTDGLLMGVLIGIWSQKESYYTWEPAFLSRHRLVGGAFVFLLFLALTTVTSREFSGIPYSNSIVSLLSALIVLLASYNKGYLQLSGIIKKGLIWIGSRSYGLYLIHIPSFYIARECWHRLQLGTPNELGFNMAIYFIFTFSLLLCLCELNYRWIELPLRNKGVGIVQKMKEKTEVKHEVSVTSY